MNFGEKLQSLRKEKGLSQEALAQKCNVSRQAVSKWENGDGYPEMDKLILISELFNVSIDFLIKNQDAPIQDKSETKYFMNKEKIDDYMKFKKNFSLRIAIACMAIILTLNLPLYFSDTQYEAFGNIGLLVVIALAVAVFIITGISSETYMELQKKEIYMSYNDSQELQNQYLKFKSKFGVLIALGIFLIIISLAVTVYIEEYLKIEKVGPMIFLSTVAIAVFIFIVEGIQDGTYKFLIQNKKFIQEQKAEEESLFGITMPLAAMIYLLIGFLTEYWHPGWMIFPITAILTLAIEKLKGK